MFPLKNLARKGYLPSRVELMAKYISLSLITDLVDFIKCSLYEGEFFSWAERRTDML